jgi:hypothetical protein
MDQAVEQITLSNEAAWLTAGYLQDGGTSLWVAPEVGSANPSPLPGAATGSWPLNLSAEAFLKLPGATRACKILGGVDVVGIGSVLTG